MRAIPITAAVVLAACTSAPALRHGTVPMPLEAAVPVAPELPDAVVTLMGTRACLGTLVDPRLVLTAAHCVTDGARHSHVRVGRGVESTPVTIAGCRVHPAAYGEATACESPRSSRLQTAHDLALLELMTPVPSSVARALPVLLRAPPDLRRRAILVVSRHATEMQSTSSWRVTRTRVARLDRALVTGPRRRQPWLSTRAGDSGGPALLETDGGLVVIGALSGGRTVWSPDSRFATTFEPENARWLEHDL